MMRTKHWWLALVLALAMLTTGLSGTAPGTRAATKDAAAEEEAATAAVLGGTTVLDTASGIVYFNLATTAESLDWAPSQENYAGYTDFIYFNGQKIGGTGALNVLHINFNTNGGGAVAPTLAAGKQHWTLGFPDASLKTGDVLEFRRGMQLPKAVGEYRVLDRDYVFTFDKSDPTYYNFGEEDEDVLIGYLNHDATAMRIGFDALPFQEETSVNVYRTYYREHILLDGEQLSATDYVHINGFGGGVDPNSMLKPDTVFFYLASNHRAVTLRKGMYIPGGKRLARDYTFRWNADASAYETENALHLLSGYPQPSVKSSTDDTYATLQVTFAGVSADTLLNLQAQSAVAGKMRLNGEPIADSGILVHQNNPSFAACGYRTEWMICVPVGLLGADEDLLTLEEGLPTSAGRLAEELTFVYDGAARVFALSKDAVLSAQPADEAGTELELPHSLTAAPGETLDLPAYAKVTLRSGGTDVLPIAWEQTSFAAAGSYEAKGSVVVGDRYAVAAGATGMSYTVAVTVRDVIVEVKAPAAVAGTYGQSLALPATVKAELTNGSEVELPVTWEGNGVNGGVLTPTSAKALTLSGTASAGDYGVAQGANLTVTLQVAVKKAKLTVRVRDAVIQVGEAVPVFGYEIVAGALVGDDTLEAKVNLYASCDADGSKSGSYAIVLTGNAEDYDLTCIDGTLTVQAAGCAGNLSGGGALLAAALCVLCSAGAAFAAKRRERR